MKLKDVAPGDIFFFDVLGEKNGGQGIRLNPSSARPGHANFVNVATWTVGYIDPESEVEQFGSVTGGKVERPQELTPATLETFRLYAEDAGNWGGNPWVSIGNISPTKAQRGNLSDLVQKGLIQIFGSGRKDDEKYIEFTEAGKALARSQGFPVHPE